MSEGGSSLELDLSSRHLEQIRIILKKIIPEREVWLYGSRANGSSYEASDVDLVFFPEISSSTGNTQEIRYKEMDMQLRLKSAFQESCIPFFVDILSWMTIPGSFQEEILHQKYIVIQKGKSIPC